MQSKHFQNAFSTSENDKIDKLIQDAQQNVNNDLQVIEWIPYDRFKDVKQIGKGGFGTIHYARWVDGYIEKWDIENQQWKRYQDEGEVEVALKKLKNVYIIIFTDEFDSIRFYGIIQDPETLKYMMVLEYAKDGNLREYLKNNYNNINWKQKLENLHSLSSSFKDYIQISGFGLSKLIGANPNNPERKNIVGVLPYISPEVLSGDEYTKAAEVYSFGIIAYELITGFPPYPDIPHDEDLAIKICNGLRPKISFHTPKLITTIMRCWDARVTHRPTFNELQVELWKYSNQESTNTTTTTAPLNYQTYPLEIYTSRLLNYSKLPKPKNEENFERELEELTKSFSHITSNDDIDEFQIL
ncbi:hypothetical protein Glove_275g23 [Diversispora epigaea]|uniref:Protein kinase domain-containing protein n=1 Tax=Diversispora epigaea TaxID=1348612 RepID=A0A397I573_9GLOM|nr:hypothetical protein Glove_275g23 [Diversispora epigaea]